MPSIHEWEQQAERRPWWTTLRAAVGVVMIVLVCASLVGLATTGSVFFKGEAARLTNPAREKVIVFDANRTLSTYEGFYRLCNDYNAAVIAARDAAREADSREKAYSAKADPFGNERTAISAIRENARALRNNARDIAASYNADSSANTRAPFKAADLPYQLDPTGATRVECGAPKEAER